MKSIIRITLVSIFLLVQSWTLFASTPPNAVFSYSPTPVCTNSPITFVDQSTGVNKITTWVWSFGSGATVTSFNGKTPPAVSYTTIGTKSVTLTVTDTLGNSASSTQIFNVQNAYANAGANVSICSTSSIRIGSSPVSGYTYNWSPTNNLSSTSIADPIANPSTTTTYTLTTVASNGCIATSQVVVTNIGVLTANAGADQTICAGDLTTIGTIGNVNYNYSWAPTAGLSATNLSHTNASPTSTTSYVLTVTTAGCVAKDTVVVNVNQLPILSNNDTLQKCSSTTIAIGSNPVGGLTYRWSPSSGLSSANIANPTSSTTASILYTLTATNNSTLCSSSKTVYVDVFAAIKAFGGLNQNVCLGNSIILGGSPIVASGGSGNYIYSWHPSSTLSATNVPHPTATPTNTTTYYLTVSDAAGGSCGSANDTVILTISPLPHPVIGMPTEFCNYSLPTALTGTPAGGYFSGIGISGNTFYPNDPYVVLGNPFPINYSYTSNGCTYDTTISVVVYPKPNANAGLPQLLCTNQNQTSVALNATGGTSYAWTPTSTLSNATIFNPIASPTATTTYFVDVTLNGCTNRDSVVITVSSTCGVDSILIANPDFVRVPTGKTSTINYVANDNLLNGSLSYTASIFALPNHGTATIVPHNVMHYTPNRNFIGIDTFVYLLLDTTVGAFHNGPVFDTAHVIVYVTPVANDDYYFVHCNDSIQKIVTANDSFGNGVYPVSISTVGAPQNGTISWSNNTFKYIPNSNFVGQDSFSYALCVNGVCDTGMVHLTVSCINPPIAVNDYLDAGNNEITSTNELSNDTYDNSAPISVTIINGPSHGTATINNNNISYTSANGYVGIDSIEYVLCNAYGCDTAWIVLKVFDNSPCQIPNGFSPNGDGTNDNFVINCAPLYDHNRLTIFNRWGNEIFSKIGYNNEWDGNYKGSPVPDGTYFYVFDPNDGIQKAKTGFIEIKR